jgi:hypothetical protein
LIGDGAISLPGEVVSENLTTAAGQDYQCFNDLPEGEYTISVAVPEGYNPTTQASYELELGPGDQTYLNFGAQANTLTQAEAPQNRRGRPARPRSSARSSCSPGWA